MLDYRSKLEKLTKTDLWLILIILILLIIVLSLYTKKILEPKQQEEAEQNYQAKIAKQEEENTYPVPQTDQELIEYLSLKGERERMEYYCGRYFAHIENKEYEQAYNLLYDEFKQKYFPSLEEYITYIEKTYPRPMSLKYNDISRQGDIYVLKLSILDVINGTTDTEKSQRIVIKENYYNEYVISFQVI